MSTLKREKVFRWRIGDFREREEEQKNLTTKFRSLSDSEWRKILTNKIECKIMESFDRRSADCEFWVRWVETEHHLWNEISFPLYRVYDENRLKFNLEYGSYFHKCELSPLFNGIATSILVQFELSDFLHLCNLQWEWTWSKAFFQSCLFRIQPTESATFLEKEEVLPVRKNRSLKMKPCSRPRGFWWPWPMADSATMKSNSTIGRGRNLHWHWRRNRSERRGERKSNYLQLRRCRRPREIGLRRSEATESN